MRSWIERISNSDFSDIAFRCTEKETDFDSDSEYSYESDDLHFSEFNIKEVSTEDESISYKDGSKYLGNIEDRKPHGQGQLTLSNGKLLRYLLTNSKKQVKIALAIKWEILPW